MYGNESVSWFALWYFFIILEAVLDAIAAGVDIFDAVFVAAKLLSLLLLLLLLLLLFKHLPSRCRKKEKGVWRKSKIHNNKIIIDIVFFGAEAVV